MGARFFRKAIVTLVCTLVSISGQAHTLYELYTLVIDNSPALKRRAAEVAQAQAQKDQFRSRLLPQISADVTRTSDIIFKDELSGVTQRYGGLRRSIQLRQALLDLSAWYGLDSARGRVLQTQQAADAARMLLTGDLVERYLAVLLAEDELARLTAEHAAVGAQVQRLQKMRERQMAKVTDLYEAQAYLQTLETQSIDATSARAIALEKLQEICGVPVTRVETLSKSVTPTGDNHEQAHWEAEALLRNPLLLSLKHAVDVAKDQTRAVRSQHAPVVTLVASNLYSDQGYDSRLQPPYRVDTFGVQVTMPIYEGGKVDASVREAIARLEIADQQYEESRREVIRQVRTDHVHVAASLARIESTGRELESRQRGVDALERGYQLGVSTIVAVLDARKLMLKADSDHHSARYDFIRDRVALRAHAGTLDEESVRETSAWFGVGNGTGPTSLSAVP